MMSAKIRKTIPVLLFGLAATVAVLAWLSDLSAQAATPATGGIAPVSSDPLSSAAPHPSANGATLCATADFTYPLTIPLVISDTFGPRLLQPEGHTRYDFHRGIDWKAPQSTTVRAVAAGTVQDFTDTWPANNPDGSGQFVLLAHEGIGCETRYNHLVAVHPSITNGLRVIPGQIIGWVGHTGAMYDHLHFEVRQGLTTTQRAAIHPSSTPFLPRTEPVSPLVALRGVYADATGLTALVQVTSPFTQSDVTAVGVDVSCAAADSRVMDYAGLNANTAVVARLDDPLVNDVCIIPADLNPANSYSVTMAFRRLNASPGVTVTARVTDVDGRGSVAVAGLLGGLQVTPTEQAARGVPDQAVTFLYTLTNLTGARETFTLTHLSAQGWPAIVTPTKYTLANNESITIIVTVTLDTDRFGPPDCGLLAATAHSNTQRVVAGFYRIYRDAYVSMSGTDTLTAGSMITPFKTINYAISRTDEGGKVHVAQGAYTENVVLEKTVDLLGGYTTDWQTRTLSAYSTTVDGARKGPVLVIDGDYGPLVDGFTFLNGHNDGGGGGVRLVGGAAPTLRSNWILTNTAQKCGGGIYVGAYGMLSPTIMGNTIVSNTSLASGGGICAEERPVLIQGNDILTNVAANYGGGVYLINSQALVQGNTLGGNKAKSGAGVYLTRGSIYDPEHSPIIQGNNVLTNVATNYGGGIYITGSLAFIQGNIISGNRAMNDGGGIYVTNGTRAEVLGNYIMRNVAEDDGGGLLVRISSPYLANNVIAENQAIGNGSGLYLGGSSSRLLHTTIARNGGRDGDGIYITTAEGISSSVTLTNTILVRHTVGVYVAASNTITLETTLWGAGDWANQRDWAGLGRIVTGTRNYWQTPGFVFPDAGDYHITLTSAAVDRGVNAGVADDIDADSRPLIKGYDIGADETALQLFLPLIIREWGIHPCTKCTLSSSP